MSNTPDHENPSTNDDNTDATKNGSENNYFSLAKSEVFPHIVLKSTPPNLSEEHARFNSH